MKRNSLAVAIALSLGVIRPREPSMQELRGEAETRRRTSAAEIKRTRRRARNANQAEVR